MSALNPLSGINYDMYTYNDELQTYSPSIVPTSAEGVQVAIERLELTKRPQSSCSNDSRSGTPNKDEIAAERAQQLFALAVAGLKHESPSSAKGNVHQMPNINRVSSLGSNKPAKPSNRQIQKKAGNSKQETIVVAPKGMTKLPTVNSLYGKYPHLATMDDWSLRGERLDNEGPTFIKSEPVSAEANGTDKPLVVKTVKQGNGNPDLIVYTASKTPDERIDRVSATFDKYGRYRRELEKSASREEREAIVASYCKKWVDEYLAVKV